MTLTVTMSMEGKPKGYCEAVKEWLLTESRQQHCELLAPQQRAEMTSHEWHKRVNQVDEQRVCAALLDPVFDEETQTLSATINPTGPLANTLKDNVDRLTLGARMYSGRDGTSVKRIASFDFIQIP
jgi:hypothetical protein